MDKHIDLPKLQHVLDTKYQQSAITVKLEKTKSWFETYKTHFADLYIILTTLVQTQKIIDFMLNETFYVRILLIFSFKLLMQILLKVM
jgi:hypothetical protein